MNNSDTLDGVGVHIYTEEGATFMDLIFEIDEAAIDNDTGEAAPAGMRRICKLRDGADLRPIAEYEAIAAKFAAEGFEDMGIMPGNIRPITYDEYVKKGYDARF